VRSTQREAPVEINPWLALCALQQVFSVLFENNMRGYGMLRKFFFGFNSVFFVYVVDLQWF